MNEKIEQLLKKAADFKKEHKLDLSSDEDLSIAVMNLVSLEEHFFFTGAKTKKDSYYDLMFQVREMRKELLKKIVKESEGELWCVSKHLLAACMRLIEVGTKYYSQQKKKEAEDLFNKAYDLYSLFWAVNLKLVPVGDFKKTDAPSKNNELMGKLNDLVGKLVDCCKE